jgi:hypothetical protein
LGGEVEMKTHDMISDEEIVRVHASANFGSVGYRQVVDESVRKVSLGFHIGSTAQSILFAHGLIMNRRNWKRRLRLTVKGKKYLSLLESGEK